jgi:hypothetical protein
VEEMDAKKRSLKQNRYRFGVVVKAFKERLNGQLKVINETSGATFPMLTVENVDFFVKDKVWGLVDRIQTPFGEIINEKELRTKTPAEFEEKMKEARAYAAMNWGLQIPLPNEDLDYYEEQLNKY